MLLGIEFNVVARHYALLGAIGTSARAMWDLTELNVTALFKAITNSKARRKVSSVVGITNDAQQAVAAGAGYGLVRCSRWSRSSWA